MPKMLIMSALFDLTSLDWRERRTNETGPATTPMQGAIKTQ